MPAARPKISEIFGRTTLSHGAFFRVIYLSLWLHAWLLGGTCGSGIAAFVIYSPIRRAPINPREINEIAEISNYFFLFGWLRPLALGIKFYMNHFSLIACAAGRGAYTPETEILKLSEFIDCSRLFLGIYAPLPCAAQQLAEER